MVDVLPKTLIPNQDYSFNVETEKYTSNSCKRVKGIYFLLWTSYIFIIRSFRDDEKLAILMVSALFTFFKELDDFDFG